MRQSLVTFEAFQELDEAAVTLEVDTAAAQSNKQSGTGTKRRPGRPRKDETYSTQTFSGAI